MDRKFVEITLLTLLSLVFRVIITVEKKRTKYFPFVIIIIILLVLKTNQKTIITIMTFRSILHDQIQLSKLYFIISLLSSSSFRDNVTENVIVKFLIPF